MAIDPARFPIDLPSDPNEDNTKAPRAAMVRETEQDIVSKATKIAINGWIHLRVKGSDYERNE